MSAKEFKTKQGIVRNVRLDKLIVDPNYQRPPNPAQAKKIEAEFNWEFVGMPVGKHRGGGYYALVDGQQRIEAIKLVYPQGVDENGNPIMIAILVISQQPEHRAYVVMNKSGTRRAVTPNEIFKANLHGGEVAEVEIEQILLEHGIEIDWSGSRDAEVGRTKAPAAFKVLYEAAGNSKRFGLTAQMLVEAFSRPDGDAVEATALASDFLRGLAKYLKTAAHKISQISKALVSADKSSAEIVQRARLAHLTNRFGQLEEVRKELERLVESNLSRSKPKTKRRRNK